LGRLVALGTLRLDLAGAAGRRGRYWDSWGDCGDQCDGSRDICADARVLRHEVGADPGEVAESGLNLLVGSTPGCNAGDDILGELRVGAHTLGVAIGGALGKR
jgi:hypothetical protein